MWGGAIGLGAYIYREKLANWFIEGRDILKDLWYGPPPTK